MSKFVCPYCYYMYKLKDVLFVCPDCNKISKPDIFEKKPVKCKNTACGKVVAIKKCPNCGEELPAALLETPHLRISTLGIDCSGRTSFIAVMMRELEKFSESRLTFEPQDNRTRDWCSENYKLIYEYHTTVESTAATSEGAYVRPLISRIKYKKSNNNASANSIIIYDGAGEDCEYNLKPTSNTCSHVKICNAIILTIDPLSFKIVLNNINEEIIKNSLAGCEVNKNRNNYNLISNLADYLRQAYGISYKDFISIPVAVVLTKFDLIHNDKYFKDKIVKYSSAVLRKGTFCKDEIIQIDYEIRDWLYNMGEELLINALEANFKTFSFFGVSSFGEPPTGSNTLSQNIIPHRVLDPILWLLKVAKFIN